MGLIKLLMQAKNRNFQRLWLGQLISQFGDRINQLALVGLIAERAPGSAVDLAKLLAFTIIPVFIVQPFAGVFVDRWDRRTTLFVCDLIRGLLVLTIPMCFFFSRSMIPIYFIVFLVFCFSRFYIPAKMSILPDIVEIENLLMANSLVSTTGMIAFVLGCALGGFLIDWFGARNGFLIDAVTFFVSGVFVFSIDMSQRLKITKGKLLKTGKEWMGPIKSSVWQEIREGFVYLVQHREIRFVIAMLFILLSAAGAVYVVIIVFIQQSFHSVTKHLGMQAVCLGAGLFLGALAYGRWGKRLHWHETIFSCLTAGGLMLTAFAWMVHHYPNVWMAGALAAVMGFVIGPIFIASNTMVQLVSNDAMRGKVFSALEIVIHFAFLISMLISSWLSEHVGRVWILTTVGGVLAVVGMVGMFKKPLKDHR